MVVTTNQALFLSGLFLGKGGNKVSHHFLECCSSLMLVSDSFTGNDISSIIGGIFDGFAKVLIMHFVTVDTLRAAGRNHCCKSKLSFNLCFDDLMANLDGFKHFLFRDLIHLTFYHGYAISSCAHHDFHVSFLKLRIAWVDDKLTINTSYIDLRHGAIEWNVTDGKGSRCS